MDQIKADFDEIRQSQLPFVEVLISMGYIYISPEEVMRQRDNNTSKFILKEIAAKAFMEINQYEFYGQTYKFSEKNVYDAVEDLENLPFEGLIDTSKLVYNMIMPKTGGKTIKVFHGGKSISKSFRFIDFAQSENNVFHVTVEYKASGKSNIRPDIVCFVNGIPFVVIENKKSGVDVNEAINQMRRNQLAEYCPKFFVYSQLLIATNGSEFRYGTTLTPAKFYSIWKEKGVSKEDLEKYVKRYIEKPIDSSVYSQVCEDLSALGEYKQRQARLVTEQDKGIVSLLAPKRLLDFTKNHII